MLTLLWAPTVQDVKCALSAWPRRSTRDAVHVAHGPAAREAPFGQYAARRATDGFWIYPLASPVLSDEPPFLRLIRGDVVLERPTLEVGVGQKARQGGVRHGHGGDGRILARGTALDELAKTRDGRHPAAPNRVY